MAGLAAIGDALAALATHWPLLALVVVAQFAHECTHFAVARWCGAAPVIAIRLKSPMRVVYDREAITPRQDAAIGVAPTVAGLVGATLWVGSVGWPAPSPLSVVGGVAWLLYTLPSRSDVSDLGPALGMDEPIGEPTRSGVIALAGVAIAGWLPAVPFDPLFMLLLAQALALASIAYFAVALYEHGVPEGSV